MKLTGEVISNSLSHINPLGERELILRVGNHVDLKIPAIENLGVTKDLNDALDFTNNDLRVLGNFPRLMRLQHLLLTKNRISKIETGLGETIPNVQRIILTNNSIHELGDLEPLTELKQLTHLSVMDNPVTKKQHYRLYLIHKLPNLRVLDFNKVSLAERQKAAQMFTKEDGTANDLSKSITENKTKTFEPGEGMNNDTTDTSNAGHALTPEEQLKIKEALKQATSLDEISRLERLLKAGHVPATQK
ncbi:leucine-rich repeat-domain-containing protein [Mycotypha africana]|uniref:leucine-rich repeat-domain-containing protein n=1 Tax=Mycotypha africana TaxID=64632 RepID=UPI00230130EA|nr:leucine-rich repeat-domain-containing protein [Mycotypha africana]KAI8984359.1 leucine-rich repeat-domain-containing protein [Mycotypha africana]